MVSTYIDDEYAFSIPKVRTSNGHYVNWDKNKVVNQILEDTQLAKKFYNYEPATKELAEEIASVIESQLIDLDVKYLNASMIREFVCLEFLKRGMIEYHNMSKRVGTSLNDAHKIDVGTGYGSHDNSNLQTNPETSHKHKADKLSKEQYLLMMPPQIADAHNKSYIHIHDLEYFGTRYFCMAKNTHLIIKDDITQNIIYDTLDNLFGNLVFKKGYGCDLTSVNKFSVYTPEGFVPIKTVARRKSTYIYRIMTKCGYYVELTSEHRVPTTNGIKQVRDINLGDSLFVSNSKYNADVFDVDTIIPGKRNSKIFSINKTLYDDYVYDISLEHTHVFFGNGILIHNCQDWDLRYLFYYGFMPDGSGTSASVSAPAKNPEVAVLHAVKMLAAAQTNFAGGQGYYNFLTFLAPYFENLPYDTIKQCMQMLVYEFTQMMVARGGQSQSKSTVFFIKKSNIIKLITMGDFCHQYLNKDGQFIFNNEDIETLSLNKITGKLEWKPITGVYIHKPHSQIKKIRLYAGKEAIVTSDHSLFTLDENANIIETSANNNPSTIICANHIPIPESCVTHNYTEDIAWLIGALIGDGNIKYHHDNIKGFDINVSNEDVANKIVIILKSLTKNIINSNFRGGCYHISCTDKELAEKFKIIGRGASNKQLPENMLTEPKEILLNLFDGLLSTDGNVSRRRYEYTTTSYILKTQLEFILNRLGFKYNLAIRDTPSNFNRNHVVYRFTLSADDSTLINVINTSRQFDSTNDNFDQHRHDFSILLPFIKQKYGNGLYKLNYIFKTNTRKLKYKQLMLLKDKLPELCSKMENIYPIEVKDITDVQNEEHEYVYDIGVKDNENFVLNNGIVAHNTIFSSLQLSPGVPTLWRDKPVVYKGMIYNGENNTPLKVYGDYEKEVRLAFKALMEVMLEGDYWGKAFNFPKPEISIEPDFIDVTKDIKQLDTLPLGTPTYKELYTMSFELASKYGTPYFDNQVPEYRGAGKGVSCYQCIPANTLIPVKDKNTGTKFIKIKHLTCDNEILTPNGFKKFENILSRRFDGDLYKITTTGGTYVECTQEHKMVIIKHGERLLKYADDIKIGDEIETIIKLPPQHHHQKDDCDVIYEPHDYIDDVAALMCHNIGNSSRLSYNYVASSHDLKMIYDENDEKIVPSFIYLVKDKYKFIYLHALCGPNKVSKLRNKSLHRLKISSTSKKYIHSILFLLKSLGFSPRYEEYQDKRSNRKLQYAIYLTKQEDINNFVNKKRGYTISITSKVIKIEHIKYHGIVYDPINVDGHIFYLGNGLLSSNCCVTEETQLPIKFENGIKCIKIEDMKKTDEVYTPTGFEKFEDILIREHDDILNKITLQGGKYIKCTNDHIIPIMCNGERIDVTAENIKIGDNIYQITSLPKMNNVPYYSENNKKDKHYKYKLSRLCGLFSAEGSSNVAKSSPNGYNKHILFTYNANELNLINDTVTLIKEIFNYDAKIYDNNHGSGKSVVIHSNGIYDWFKNNNILHIPNKQFVPPFIFTLDDECKFKFLHGYYDGDGCLRLNGKNAKNRIIEMNTISEELASGIMLLLTELGYHIRYGKYLDKRENRKQRHILYLSRNNEIQDFLHARRRENIITLPVKKIEKINYKGKVYDPINVKGHVFYLGNGMLSSNCAYNFGASPETDPEFYDKLYFKDGAHFSMGSGQVVTLNCPRAAYDSNKDIDTLINILKKYMNIAKDVFIIKKRWMNEIEKCGKLPFVLQRPRDPVTGKPGAIAVDVKSLVYTIGIIGFNEMVQFISNEQIHESKNAQKIAIRVLVELNKYAAKLSEDNGIEIVVARTPAETTGQRFAVADLLNKNYTENAKLVVKGDINAFDEFIHVTTDLPVYYTNGAHIAVNANISLYEKLKIESPFFMLVKGGNIFNIFIGESRPNPQGLYNFTMNIVQNTQIGYFSFTRDMTLPMRRYSIAKTTEEC